MPPIPKPPPKIPGDLARGNLTVFLGDSNTQGTDSTLTGGQFQLGPSTYVSYVCLESNGQVRLLANEGVGGETSTQIVARVDDVIALRPAKVILMMGTNDMPNYAGAPTTTLTTLKANIASAVQRLRGAKIDVILCTILPNSTPQYRPGIVRANAWIRWYAEQHGLMLLDFFGLVADPELTHGWRLRYAQADGVHTAPYGAYQMGVYAAAQLAAYYPNVLPYLCQENDTGDQINLVDNGIMVGDANADGVANSWGVTGSGGTVTTSLVDDAVITGNWQRLDISVSGTRVFSQGITPAADTFAAGDVLQFSGRIRTIDTETSDTGTATSATSTTLVDSGKSWATDEWSVVAITGGTGVGQTRAVSANNGTTLTVPTWTTTPDTTSTYIVTGGMTVTIRLRFTAPGGPFDLAPITAMRTEWNNKIFCIQGEAPTGTTLAEVQVTNGAGTGKIDVSQLTVINLTALGLV